MRPDHVQPHPPPGRRADRRTRRTGHRLRAPFFPLGGFSPLQSSALTVVAARLDASPMSVALAWLLRRSPNILLIPGTSSVAHLRENVAGAGLRLPDDDLLALDKIGRRPHGGQHAGSTREGRSTGSRPGRLPVPRAGSGGRRPNAPGPDGPGACS
ncbi:oxidoreductase [Kitasatospora sp. Ki12]